MFSSFLKHQLEFSALFKFLFVLGWLEIESCWAGIYDVAQAGLKLTAIIPFQSSRVLELQGRAAIAGL